MVRDGIAKRLEGFTVQSCVQIFCKLDHGGSGGPLWEWPKPPPRRAWRRPALRVALALVVTLSLVAADEPARLPLPINETTSLPLPVPDEPVWCACVWWPSGPARTIA
jgi:hypothetical protein